MKAGWVLAGLFALSLVAYIDRAVVSQAANRLAMVASTL